MNPVSILALLIVIIVLVACIVDMFMCERSTDAQAWDDCQESLLRANRELAYRDRLPIKPRS